VSIADEERKQREAGEYLCRGLLLGPTPVDLATEPDDSDEYDSSEGDPHTKMLAALKTLGIHLPEDTSPSNFHERMCTVAPSLAARKKKATAIPRDGEPSAVDEERTRPVMLSTTTGPDIFECADMTKQREAGDHLVRLLRLPA
jgi:hypothetical protein